MAKKRIEIIATKETYKNLQTFKDIKELNHVVREYKGRFSGVLTKSAIKVLDLLHRYSAKYTGVSFLNKNTIAKELEINRRTVIRACQLLESLGIIKQYEMKRKSDMMQTGNAIVIQPIEEPEAEIVTQENEKMSHHENNISLKQNINNKSTTEIDHTFLPNFIDSSFIETARPFIAAKEIYKLWLRVLIAYKNSKISRPLSEVIGCVNKAFKQTVFMFKQGRIKKSFNGYFYSLMTSYFYSEKAKETNNPLFYNWLEA